MPRSGLGNITFLVCVPDSCRLQCVTKSVATLFFLPYNLVLGFVLKRADLDKADHKSDCACSGGHDASKALCTRSYSKIAWYHNSVIFTQGHTCQTVAEGVRRCDQVKLFDMGI